MGRVKNTIILFLVLLNGMMAIMLWSEKKEYELTTAQSNMIMQVLKENKIGLYTTILTDYSPKNQLIIKPVMIQDKTVRELFFSNEKAITVTAVFNGTVYRQDGKELTLSENTMLFDNPLGTGEILTTQAAVLALCEEWMKNNGKKMNVGSREYIRDYFMEDRENSQWIVEYRSKYMGYVVYSDSIQFRITEDGIISIRFDFFEAIGFSDEPRPIYSADEALFKLVYQIKSDYGGENNAGTVFVQKMDMVYASEEGIVDGTMDIKTTPFYRFYIKASGQGITRIEPFMINAYNNRMKE